MINTLKDDIRMSEKCPNCDKLMKPNTVLRCDCGYDFTTGQMKEPLNLLVDRRDELIVGRYILLTLGLGISLFLAVLSIILFGEIILAAGGFPDGIPFIIGLFTGTICWVLLGLLWTRWMANYSRCWHVAKGKIIHATVDEWEDDGSTCYVPKIVYEYVVEKAIYSSKKIAFVLYRHDSPLLKHFFSIGKIVNIYYKPGNHKVAVLIPGYNEEYESKSFFTFKGRIILILLLIPIVYFALYHFALYY